MSEVYWLLLGKLTVENCRKIRYNIGYQKLNRHRGQIKMKKEKKQSTKRTVLIVVCIVLGIVLAALIGATAFTKYLLGRINYAGAAIQPTLSQEEIDAIENASDETVSPEETAPEVNEEDIIWSDVDATIGGDDIVNIMLIGQDRRPGEDRARSDSMILVTFNKTKKTITMTSFMRDLYVKIPGGYKDNRINTSYSLGGMELLDETLFVNFGVEVDANVEVDFDQFEHIIDLLGGVEIELDEAEAKYINKKMNTRNVQAGLQTLNGKQALWYARNRSTGGTSDFGRTNRQRTVLNALIEAYKNKPITEMIGLLDDILPLITTDLEQNEILSYVVTLFPLLADSEIVTQHIPVQGGYYDATIRGMQVLVPNMDVNRQALIDSLTNGEALEETE